MSFTVIMLAFAVVLKTGVDAQTITTQNQIVTSLPGADTKLPCYVQNAQSGGGVWALAASWRKIQDPVDTQGQTVNQAANIQPPFPPSRFSITTQESTTGSNPGTSVDLTIKKLTTADSGKYRCSIMKNSAVVASVTHTLKVYKQASELILEARTDANAENNITIKAGAQGGSVSFRVGLSGYIRCAAIEAYPDPLMKIFIGNKLVTGNFSPRRSELILTGSPKYMQTLSYIDELYTNLFSAKDTDHMKELRCEVDPNVAGASPLTASMTIQVEYKPILTCTATQQAMPDDKNFQLTCNFKARPSITQIQWKTQTPGEVFTTNMPKKSGRVATTKKDGMEFVALLTFDRIEEKHYQMYELSVTNSIGTTTANIKLEKGRGTDRNINSAMTAVPHTVWLAVVLLASFLLHQH